MVARQAPLSVGFSRQEYWSGKAIPRDLPDPGIEPGSATLQAGSLPSEPPGKPLFYYLGVCNYCLALASLLLSYSFIKLASKKQAVLVGTWLSMLSGLALPSVPFVSPHSSLSLLPAVFLSLWPLCLSPPPSPILASIQSVLCWLCPLSLALFLPRSLFCCRCVSFCLSLLSAVSPSPSQEACAGTQGGYTALL